MPEIGSIFPKVFQRLPRRFVFVYVGGGLRNSGGNYEQW